MEIDQGIMYAYEDTQMCPAVLLSLLRLLFMCVNQGLSGISACFCVLTEFICFYGCRKKKKALNRAQTTTAFIQFNPDYPLPTI